MSELNSTQVVVALIGAGGVLTAALLANRNAKRAVVTAKSATDLSYPLAVLKETIKELRTEIIRLQKTIDGLNKTIATDQAKYVEVVAERDALLAQKILLEEKVTRLEAHRDQLLKEARA